jgi:hypothetical protein
MSHTNLSSSLEAQLEWPYSDKISQEETLETWMKTIDNQPFATTPEPLQLMDVVTGLVSRAQLIEWGES